MAICNQDGIGLATLQLGDRGITLMMIISFEKQRKRVRSIYSYEEFCTLWIIYVLWIGTSSNRVLATRQQRTTVPVVDTTRSNHPPSIYPTPPHSILDHGCDWRADLGSVHEHVVSKRSSYSWLSPAMWRTLVISTKLLLLVM